MDHIDIPELVGGNGSSLYRYCCRCSPPALDPDSARYRKIVRKSRCMYGVWIVNIVSAP